jgi:hypothetical protein
MLTLQEEPCFYEDGCGKRCGWLHEGEDRMRERERERDDMIIKK